MARPAEYIDVPPTDRTALRKWLRSTSIRKGLADRARILLLSARKVAVTDIAATVGMSANSVYKWRHRYLAHGVDGLYDRPRPGQPRKLTPAVAEKILRLTVERIPHEATHWSLRLMAKHAGVTQHQVREVWTAADLKPHRLRTFKPGFPIRLPQMAPLYTREPPSARNPVRRTIVQLQRPSPQPTLTWNRPEPLLSGHFSDTAPHLCPFFASLRCTRPRVSLPAPAAPRSSAASRRRAAGSDDLPPAGASSIWRASPAGPQFSPAAAGDSSATSA